MLGKMVEWLNGLSKWLFKRSTICLSGDQIAVARTAAAWPKA
jgi:hypothetical protein